MTYGLYRGPVVVGAFFGSTYVVKHAQIVALLVPTEGKPAHVCALVIACL